jgi:hypothetical protein
MFKYLRENLKYWVFALVISLMYGAYAAYAEAAPINKVEPITQPTAELLKTGEFMYVLKDSTGTYDVNDTWLSGRIMAAGTFKGNPVYLIRGETGGVACEQNWVVFMTGTKPQSWLLQQCYTETFSFDIGTQFIQILMENEVFKITP